MRNQDSGHHRRSKIVMAVRIVNVSTTLIALFYAVKCDVSGSKMIYETGSVSKKSVTFIYFFLSYKLQNSDSKRHDYKQ